MLKHNCHYFLTDYTLAYQCYNNNNSVINLNITISTSSALSTNVLLIFDMHHRKGGVFLKISFSFHVLPSLYSSTVLLPFITKYTSL